MEHERTRLLVLPALNACTGAGGSYVLTRKFVDGVHAYVNRWPGEVMVSIDCLPTPDTNLDHVQVRPDDVSFLLYRRPAQWPQLSAQIQTARLVLASLVEKNAFLAELCRSLGVPLVYISEYSLETRRQIIRAEFTNLIRRWHREFLTAHLERRFIRAVKLADGVQCNGTPTYHDYRSVSPRPMLFFDSRVSGEELASMETIDRRASEMLGGRPLRLAFSGRLIRMKGAHHLPVMARELQALGVPFTLDICGAGVLEDQIRRDLRRFNLAEQVHLRGVMDFHTELLPFIARQVDLFVCCHPQGDPSCTYLETMACGTPIVGYDNAAFRGLVEASGVGWTTPLNDPASLARRIAVLNDRREEIANASRAARAFAAEHTFENTMRRRVEHMLSCCASPVIGSGTGARA